MPPLDSLIGFIGASLVLSLIPGPGVLYVIGRSVSQGQTAGLVSVLGLSAGAFVHVVFATLGLSAILLASATAFSLVKFLGAAYLIYLGVQALLTRSSNVSIEHHETKALRRVFRDGVVVSLLNPKIAIFFLAYLPQFADPSRGSLAAQTLLLGLIYVGLALVTDSLYSVLGARAGGLVTRVASRSQWPRYGTGLVYIGLGVGTALAKKAE